VAAFCFSDHGNHSANLGVTKNLFREADCLVAGGERCRLLASRGTNRPD
jgi:hypothetical protein